MKASELIAQLQALVAAHGDLDVRLHNDLEDRFEEVNEVLARRLDPSHGGVYRIRRAPEKVGEVFFGVDWYSIGDWGDQLRYDAVIAAEREAEEKVKAMAIVAIGPVT